MLQAVEFLGPIGWLFAGVGITLAAVASAFAVINYFRRAIGRQIKSETTETLTKLGVNVEILVEQGKAHSAALAEQGKAIAALAEQGKAHSAALAEQGKAIAALAEQGKGHSAALAEQGKALGEQGKALGEQGKALGEQGKALAEQGKAIAALEEQGKETRAGMRQLEMKVDKTAADVNWIRGVLEGFGRNPEKGPGARAPVSEWREDGDNASP